MAKNKIPGLIELDGSLKDLRKKEDKPQDNFQMIRSVPVKGKPVVDMRTPVK